MSSEVPEGWSELTLRDVCDVLAGPAFKSRDFLDEGEYRLCRGANVSQQTLNWSDTRYWPGVNGYEPYQLEVGDVILAMDRPWLEAGLKYARVRDRDVPALLVQRVARLRATGRLNQRFLYYLIGSPAFTGHVRSVSTGSTVPHISADQIKEFSAPVPPLVEQQAIAETLGSLDDRIEHLNERVELALRTLDACFVYVSNGTQPLSEVATVIAGQSPPGASYNESGEGAPFLQGSAQFTDLVPVPEKWCTDPKREAQARDILFSVRAPVGDLNVATERTIIGRGLAALRSAQPGALLAALRHAARQWEIYDGSGTTFGSISQRDLKATDLRWPVEADDRALTLLEDLLVAATAATSERASLKRTRDVLLPQLVTGKLRIKDVDGFLERAGLT